MKQTKELNAFFIHMLCWEDTVADGVPQLPRLWQPCTAPGHPTLPTSALARLRGRGGMSGFLGGNSSPLPLGVWSPQKGWSGGAGMESCGGWWPEGFSGSCGLWSLIRSPTTKCSHSHKSWCAEGSGSLSCSSWTTAVVTLLTIQTPPDHAAWEARFPKNMLPYHDFYVFL